MSNAVLVFENPLVVNGRFLGEFNIGVRMPTSPRKKVKVYELTEDILYDFLDFLLGLTEDTFKRVLRYNIKWFTEVIAVTYETLPRYIQLIVVELAVTTPQTKSLCILLSRKVEPTELPF